MHYTLVPAHNSFHQKLIECLSCCFQDVPELAKDMKRLGRRDSPMPTCCG
jgi:hypothetical protein